MLEGLMMATGRWPVDPAGLHQRRGRPGHAAAFTRRLLANQMRQRAEEQAIRQRAFADDLQPRGGPAPREPLGREPM
jgi:UPF0716 protein FxsA